jgi:hypothetical protein
MRQVTRGRILGGLVIALFLWAAAGVPAQDPQAGGTLRVGLQGDFTTLDPHMSTSAVDRDVSFYAPPKR